MAGTGVASVCEGVGGISKQFEFHPIGADAPEGQLDAAHLVAIVSGLGEVTTRIGRIETDAVNVGRAPSRVHRVARLYIGLVAGSTTVQAQRVGGGEGALDFDLPDEAAFDRSFEELVQSIADDRRPDWVTDSLSRATEDLTVALQQAAPRVEFRVDGVTRRSFNPADVHRETWRVASVPGPESVTFVGRLFSADLHTHRFAVQDDVGHQVALPDVSDDAHLARLLGVEVLVTGAPAVDAHGRLTHLHDAVIDAAPDPVGETRVDEAMTVEDLLASAPGPDPDGAIELSDDEWDDVWAALHA